MDDFWEETTWNYNLMNEILRSQGAVLFCRNNIVLVNEPKVVIDIV